MSKQWPIGSDAFNFTVTLTITAETEQEAQEIFYALMESALSNPKVWEYNEICSKKVRI